jgi:hypothetical protein
MNSPATTTGIARYHEKVMGTTWDARRSARIRYVPSAAADTPAGVVPLDSYRDL